MERNYINNIIYRVVYMANTCSTETAAFVRHHKFFSVIFKPKLVNLIPFFCLLVQIRDYFNETTYEIF